MVFLGEILLMFFAALCVALSCNVTREYILKNELTGKIRGCPPCRACPVGEEPEPPCGTVVGLYDRLRKCKPCKNNYYSAQKDFLPCQRCQNSKCVANEIDVGICEINKQDTSHCTGLCVKGYVMNRNGSVCVVEELQLPAVVPSATKDSGMPVGHVVGIILGVVLFSLAIMIGLIWYFKCRNSTAQRVTFTGDEKRDKNNSSATVEVVPEIRELLISQEQSQNNGESVENKPCPETVIGHMNTSPTSSETNQTSFGCPLGNDSVLNNVQGQAPSPVYQGHDVPNVTRFGDLPSSVYQKICKTFNAGAAGKNSDALAGWLGFTVDQDRDFELVTINKADAVIRSWTTKSENTIDKFIEILKEHGMTNLVDEINNARRA